MPQIELSVSGQDLSDGGKYHIQSTCLNWHGNGHSDYMSRILLGEWGKDPTAFRQRCHLYCLPPLFRYRLPGLVIAKGLATADNVEEYLENLEDESNEVVERLKELGVAMISASPEQRRITFQDDAARRAYYEVVDNAGKMQEQLQYDCPLACNMLGKFPDMALLASCLSWNMDWLAMDRDTKLGSDEPHGFVGPCLAKKHIDVGVRLANWSNAIALKLMTPAAAPTATGRVARDADVSLHGRQNRRSNVRQQIMLRLRNHQPQHNAAPSRSHASVSEVRAAPCPNPASDMDAIAGVLSIGDPREARPSAHDSQEPRVRPTSAMITRPIPSFMDTAASTSTRKLSSNPMPSIRAAAVSNPSLLHAEKKRWENHAMNQWMVMPPARTWSLQPQSVHGIRCCLAATIHCKIHS